MKCNQQMDSSIYRDSLLACASFTSVENDFCPHHQIYGSNDPACPLHCDGPQLSKLNCCSFVYIGDIITCVNKTLKFYLCSPKIYPPTLLHGSFLFPNSLLSIFSNYF